MTAINEVFYHPDAITDFKKNLCSCVVVLNEKWTWLTGLPHQLASLIHSSLSTTIVLHLPYFYQHCANVDLKIINRFVIYSNVIYMLRKTHTLACGMKAAFLSLDNYLEELNILCI